jgi:hypothetical protein
MPRPRTPTAELTEVVGSLPDGVAVLPGHRPDRGSEVRDGKPAGRGREGGRGGQHDPDPRLVQVDAAGAGGADPRWPRQLIEHAVGGGIRCRDLLQRGRVLLLAAAEPGFSAPDAMKCY